jgi:hypothetical protein
MEELHLCLLHFGPFQLHSSEIEECIGIEQDFPSCSQICQEGGTGGRLFPILKPTPFAANDVHKSVSHGTKATAKIARKLLSAERRSCLQNPVIGPAVVFVEELNVIFGHSGVRAFFRSQDFDDNRAHSRPK